MNSNSGIGSLFEGVFNNFKFISELRGLHLQRPVPVNIPPVDLVYLIVQMQRAYEFNSGPKGEIQREEILRICTELEGALELPPVVKKRIDDKWEELGVHRLDNENPTN